MMPLLVVSLIQRMTAIGKILPEFEEKYEPTLKATGATQHMGKISLKTNYLISLGKYIIATDVKCYHTIFFKMNFFYE